MIDKGIIDIIETRMKINKRDLIEKDLILHRLLDEFSSNKYFFDNFAFKGGTCLIKCFLDYYRFSEDLDFTFINQGMFEKKSKGQSEKMLSNEINNLAM
jgi:predicted nucleotidyltransferase component of viral defense system